MKDEQIWVKIVILYAQVSRTILGTLLFNLCIPHNIKIHILIGYIYYKS